jgi:hydrogenase maturation protease
VAERTRRDGGRILVLGVGNPDRGDDGAGRAAARALRPLLPEDVEVTEADGEMTDLLGRLEQADAAFVIDACLSGAPAGTLHRFDVSEAPLPEGVFSVSSHGLGLHQAVELARAFGQLPGRCVVYAVEGASFETGAPLSPPVAAAAAEAAERVRAEIAAVTDQQERGHA